MPQGLRKRGKFWHYEFSVGGHAYRGTTGATDLETAKLVLQQVRKDTILGEHGLAPAPTLKAAAEAWMAAKRHSSPSHLRIARQALDALAPLHGFTLDRLTTQRVEAWRNDYLEGHSAASANNRLRYLKAWCRWAIQRVPFDLKPVKFQRRERPVLKPDQVIPFLRAVNQGSSRGRALRCAVRVMLATGMRESEILGMRWEWLDFEAGTYRTGKAKSKRTRTIPVPAWALEPLLLLPRTVNGLIFPGHTQGWLKRAINRGADEVKLKLSNHRLRASFATIQHAMGTPLAEVQAMLGHQNISTTLVYIETDLDRKKAAQERMAKGMGLA